MKIILSSIFILLIGLKIYSQDTIKERPLSSDFLYYYDHPEHFQNPTHPLGYIPLPFNLTFENWEDTAHSLKSTLPVRYDLREKGHVTSVKNQGTGKFGGNCWAFTTYGAVESQWLKQGYDTFNLSEHHLASCHGFEWKYGEGGNDMLAMAYLTRLAGPLPEAQVPYDPGDSTGFQCQGELKPLAYVPEVRWLPNNQSILKQALMDYGALSVSMTWKNHAFNSNDNTFFYYGTTPVNHAVTLVGWDDQKPTDAGTGAWILKNQWTDEWADSGYFYIAYEDNKINETVSYYPVKSDTSSINQINYYDTLGSTKTIGFNQSTGYALTHFKTSKPEVIKKVGTFVQASGSFIDIEIYSNKNGDTLSGLLNHLKDQFCRWPGFYTFDIPTAVSDDYYVKIKYYTPGNLYPIPVETYIAEFAHPHLHPYDQYAFTDSFSFYTSFTPLEVMHTHPADSVKNYALHQPLRITFNRPVDSADFSQISLTDSTLTNVNLDVKIDSQNLIIYHDNLTKGMSYQLFIPDSSVKDSNNVFNDSLTLFFTTKKNNPPGYYDPFNLGHGIAQHQHILLHYNDSIIIHDSSKIHLTYNGNILDGRYELKTDSAKPTQLQIWNNNIQANKTYDIILEDSLLYSIGSELFSNKDTAHTEPVSRPAKTSSYPPNQTNGVGFSESFFITFDEEIVSIDTSHIRFIDNEFILQNLLSGAILHYARNQIEIRHRDFEPGKQYFLVLEEGTVRTRTGATNKTFYLTFSSQKKGAARITHMTPGRWSENHRDSLITLTLSQEVNLDNTDNIMLTSGPDTINVKNINLAANNKTLTIQTATLPPGRKIKVSLGDSLFSAIGHNWISGDGATWLGVGIGNPAYEHDLVVRTYTDTSTTIVPAFKSSKSQMCTNSSVTYTDNSTGTITSYQWDFGEGATPATSTSSGPHEVSYSTDGVKEVKLVISNGTKTDSISKFPIKVTGDAQVYIPEANMEIPHGKSDTLIAYGADQYQWVPTFFLDTNYGPKVILNTSEMDIGDYWFWVAGTEGDCSTTDSIKISVTDRPDNDHVCDAFELQINQVNGPYTNEGATVEFNEPHPPTGDCNAQDKWCFEYNAEPLLNSIWFKFKAPASGIVSISTRDPYHKNTPNSGLEFDNQIAVYEADSCIDILQNNYSILAANDDYFDQNYRFSSAIEEISGLTPGQYYWLQLDGSAGGESGKCYIDINSNALKVEDKENNKPAQLIIYPNPAQEKITVALTGIETKEQIHIYIYNNQGQLYHQNSLRPKGSSITHSLSVDHFPAGYYIIQLKGESLQAQQKVFINTSPDHH